MPRRCKRLAVEALSWPALSLLQRENQEQRQLGKILLFVLVMMVEMLLVEIILVVGVIVVVSLLQSEQPS